MHYVIGVVGLLVFLLLAWLPSADRRAAGGKLGRVVILLVVQFALGFLLLRTGAGTAVIRVIRDGFQHILDYAAQGTAFVFGDVAKYGQTPAFLFSVLMPIVFVSALIGILQHIRLLPLIIKYLGLALSWISGFGKVESFNAVASAILGQSEVFISLRGMLDRIPPQRMYTLAASAMSTVSASILGAYMQLIDAKFVITAIVLNLLGVFAVTALINPYPVDPLEDAELLEAESAEARQSRSFFEMLTDYILVGFKVAFTVAAMLIGFIALLAMINGIFAALFNGTTFQDVMGHVFAPLAWLTGIPWHEAADAGRYMGTKLVSNEIVAMQELHQEQGALSGRAQAIVSTYLVSFANFSSIAIIIGAVRSLNERQGLVTAGYGLRLLYSATLVSFISATIVGLLS
ncbi:NupC/NupG family nucleoside CNT transporter [Nocardia sp. CDC159]|uniref:NupC/NupG family nucleoside CNT transporter n=1 Tax=Nocardia pulmonis TaxID=2951408 RepID=A0A9X2EDU5_9NOCA|nr:MULTISPECIES: nucleoside transporter C-terminal domain-containing protein [Nocardia]MCM6776413.1 NupC/NupG family nucleoside CNT transporter [Nocardia pulmonis]MCM6788837.1 NupC/NupG family nucleoside CNT transporter [Nocardia sp. CDC159]